MAKIFWITLLSILTMFPINISAKKYNETLLRRVMGYPMTIRDSIPDSISTNVYLKYHVTLQKRNFTLIGIPSLFYLARDGKKDFLGESYSHVIYYNQNCIETHTNLKISTIYHNHNTLEVLMPYLSPNFYHVTLFKDCILSPLVLQNKHFYSYESMPWNQGTRFFFHPKVKNTQLISGYIDVNDTTGQMIHFVVEGEYDMVHFVLEGNMGNKGYHTLVPSHCNVKARLHIAGNHIFANYTTYYDMPQTLPDSMKNVEDKVLMEKLRPEPLTIQEQYIFNQHETDQQINEVIIVPDPKKKKRAAWAKHVFWDVIGDNLLNRIHANLGTNRKGHLRIGPIFNPL